MLFMFSISIVPGINGPEISPVRLREESFKKYEIFIFI
jgi:hypothetical protein